MNRCTHKNQTIMALILVCVLGVVKVFYGGMASALTYQEEIGVNFTFNTALRITISSDIHIDNLAPGASADSNIVNVNVLTNAPNGYTLNASVGNDTTYDTDDLLHDTSQTNVFANTAFSTTPTITSNADLAADTWAFSYSTNNGTNWANYNGLPMYDDTEHIATLKQSSSPATTLAGDDVKFKIGAKASSQQISGTFRNVINFNLVAAPTPTSLAMAYASAGATMLNGYYKMQDMTSAICNAVEVEDDQLQVIDSRDNKVYWIAKLADGKCWMTQNLDHDIVTTANFYTYANTDIGHGATPNTSATWTADKATYVTGDTTWAANNTAGRYIQESYDPGDIIWNGNPGNMISIENLPQGTDYHLHAGNFYNWTAAVAMNSSSSYSSSTDVDQSICPAGWTLPRNDSSVGSFGYLFNILGDDYWKTWESPLYYSAVGMWTGSSSYSNYMIQYWTSHVQSVSLASVFTQDADTGDYTVNGSMSRYLGSSVRCVSR